MMTGNLDAFQTIVDSTIPPLQLKASVCAIREYELVFGEFLDGLGVEVICCFVILRFEGGIAFLFELVCLIGGHLVQNQDDEPEV